MANNQYLVQMEVAQTFFKRPIENLLSKSLPLRRFIFNIWNNSLKTNSNYNSIDS